MCSVHNFLISNANELFGKSTCIEHAVNNSHQVILQKVPIVQNLSISILIYSFLIEVKTEAVVFILSKRNYERGAL